MSASIGKAIHRFPDGSEHVLRVEIDRKGAIYPAAIGEPYVFEPRLLNPNAVVYIGGARQARVLANYLRLLADRLEARGEL